MTIVEKDIAFVKSARDTKGVNPVINLPGVNYPRLGKWSKGYHYRDSIDSVIDHFMPVENFDGVRLGLSA